MIVEDNEYIGEEINDNIYEEKEADDFVADEIVLKKEDEFIDEDSRCKNCGHEIDADDKICTECGRVLVRASESAYA